MRASKCRFLQGVLEMAKLVRLWCLAPIWKWKILIRLFLVHFVAFEAVGGRFRQLKQVKSNLPQLGEIWWLDFHYLLPSRDFNFCQICLQLTSMNSIVSWNPLEPKNVFLRQKTSELLLFYGKKLCWEMLKKSWFLRFGFFGPGDHNSGPILIKLVSFWPNAIYRH